MRDGREGGGGEGIAAARASVRTGTSHPCCRVAWRALGSLLVFAAERFNRPAPAAPVAYWRISGAVFEALSA